MGGKLIVLLKISTLFPFANIKGNDIVININITIIPATQLLKTILFKNSLYVVITEAIYSPHTIIIQMNSIPITFFKLISISSVGI